MKSPTLSVPWSDTIKPILESLEDRILTAVLVLDPTPVYADTWASLARTRNPAKIRILDVDRDRKVTSKDLDSLMSAIREQTARYFQGLPLEVVVDEGDAWIAKQKETGDAVFVMWVGGSPPADPFFKGVVGQAILATRDEGNWCGPAWTYPAEVLRLLARTPGKDGLTNGRGMRWHWALGRWRPSPGKANTALFIKAVASTIAHEFAHLLGVPHGPARDDIMNAAITKASINGHFYPEAWAEIAASLDGSQPTQPMPDFV